MAHRSLLKLHTIKWCYLWTRCIRAAIVWLIISWWYFSIVSLLHRHYNNNPFFQSSRAHGSRLVVRRLRARLSLQTRPWLVRSDATVPRGGLRLRVRLLGTVSYLWLIRDSTILMIASQTGYSIFLLAALLEIEGNYSLDGKWALKFWLFGDQQGHSFIQISDTESEERNWYLLLKCGKN